jgi:hypothetical protein
MISIQDKWGGMNMGLYDGFIADTCGLKYDFPFCKEGCCGKNNMCSQNNCTKTKQIKIGEFNGIYDSSIQMTK